MQFVIEVIVKEAAPVLGVLLLERALLRREVGLLYHLPIRIDDFWINVINLLFVEHLYK